MLNKLTNTIWKKLSQLKVGNKIAIENQGRLDFDEIVAIKPLGKQHVYDIEVEGAHNFVGNGIIAHNTIITGNLMTGGLTGVNYNAMSDSGTATYASTDDDLYIEDILEVGNTLYVNGSQITPGGYWQRNGTNLSPTTITDNIGIGTTGPSYPLDVSSSGDTYIRALGTGARVDYNTPSGRFIMQRIIPNGTGVANNDVSGIFLAYGTDSAGTTGEVGEIRFLTSTVAPGAVTGDIAFLVPNNTTIDNISETMRISGGNVGIGTTGPGSKLDIWKTTGSSADIFHISSTTAGDLVTVLSNGNVGIGTTGPSSKLHVLDSGASPQVAIFAGGSGTPYITLGSGSNVGGYINYDLVNGVMGLQNHGYVLGSGGGIAIKAGNVGIGTTSPLQKLHVEGQCVAWDSLIPVRRKKKRKKKAGEDDEDEAYDYLEVMVKDVLPDDEVLSLNEETGRFEYQTVEKTLDMGTKEIYELTTETGKKIETTGNHPYLARTTAGLFVESNPHQEKDNRQQSAQDHYISTDIPKAVHFSNFPSILTTNNKNIVPNVKWNVKDKNSSIVFGVETVIPTKAVIKAAAEKLINNPENAFNHGEENNFVINNTLAQWTKVVYLQEGDEIATVDGFEKIISIRILPPKHVYDLQISNTHNFVANGIVAHNTYISGNVGIGTTAPGAKLEVGGQVKITGGTPGANKVLTSDSVGLATWETVAGVGGVTGTGAAGQATFWTGTSTVSGDNAFWWDNTNKRVGIGTTGPNEKLDVVGNIRVGSGGVIYSSAGNLVFGAGNSSQRWRIEAAGSVLVGGSAEALGTYIRGEAGAVNMPNYSFNSDSSTGMWSPATSNIAFSIAGAEKVRINSSGNVGIGTTGPGYKLDISGDLRLSGIQLSGTSTSRNLNNIANYTESGEGLTGAIVVQTSVPQDSSTMINMDIDLYGKYSGDGNSVIKISTGGYWTPESNGGFRGSYTNPSNARYRVRYMRNTATGNTAVVIGETTTTWNYPKAVVSRVLAGHSWSDSYATGWTITRTADLSGYTNSDDVTDVTYASTASSMAFSGITSGTNTQAAMIVSTGASLNYGGTGTINASSLIGGTWAIPGTIGSTTPNTGAFTTLSSSGGEGTYNAPNFGSSNLGAINILASTSNRQNGITFSSAGSTNAQAGLYVHQDNSLGTHMYLATTDNY
ncbi:MAG: hypothetical protein U0946_02505, partial [Patescibacteria group bacterium]|nr:hypothetical protein [Patescibacteria group bacterium]